MGDYPIVKNRHMGNVYTSVKEAARHLMESATPGYRFLLTRGLQVRRHLEPPCAPWHNAVLQTRQERDRAIEQVTNLGLPLMADPPKNWDSLAEILQAIELAEQCGVALTAPIDLSCNERVVHWEWVDLDYTLLIFTLRKSL